MFDNIGGKLKTLAVGSFSFGLIISIVGGIFLIFVGIFSTVSALAPGIVLLIAGPLFSWLGSLTTYGFGELIEQNKIQTTLLQNINRNLNTSPNSAPVNTPNSAPVQPCKPHPRLLDLCTPHLPPLSPCKLHPLNNTI